MISGNSLSLGVGLRATGAAAIVHHSVAVAQEIIRRVRGAAEAADPDHLAMALTVTRVATTAATMMIEETATVVTKTTIRMTATVVMTTNVETTSEDSPELYFDPSTHSVNAFALKPDWASTWLTDFESSFAKGCSTSTPASSL